MCVALLISANFLKLLIFSDKLALLQLNCNELISLGIKLRLLFSYTFIKALIYLSILQEIVVLINKTKKITGISGFLQTLQHLDLKIIIEIYNFEHLDHIHICCLPTLNDEYWCVIRLEPNKQFFYLYDCKRLFPYIYSTA